MVGAAAGWAAKELPSAEDVAAHWGEICDVSGVSEPHSLYDEVLDVRTTLRRDGLA